MIDYEKIAQDLINAADTLLRTHTDAESIAAAAMAARAASECSNTARWERMRHRGLTAKPKTTRKAKK